MATAEVQRLLVTIGLRDGLSGPLGRLNRQLGNTSRGVGQLQQNLARGLAVGAAVATGAILGSIRAAIGYDDAFAGVRKTVQATDAELAQLSEQFRQLATEIPISASEFARLGEAAGALGVPTASIKEFVRVTALLGVTTNLTADEAADSLGRIGNVLHLTTDEYSRFASALVALGNAGASTEAEIIAIAERAGSAGELIGLSTEQVLAFSSAVASLGIEPEAGGSSLQKFFIETTKHVAAGSAELAVLAKTAGMTGDAFKQAFEKDAGAALQAFLAGLGELSQNEQLFVLEDLKFNDIRITRALLGLANNTELVTAQMGVASDAFRENNALTTEAGKRFETLASQLRLLRNNFVELAISFGEGALPKLTELTTRLTAFLKDNRGNIQAFGSQFATLLADVFSEENIRGAAAFAREVLPSIADGFRLAGSGIRFAIDIWRQLPPDLQKLLVGALVVNKISGGLVGSLISGAIAGVARGVLGINAAVVNVNGGVVNGGGVGGVGGSRVPGLIGLGLGAVGVGAAVQGTMQIVDAIERNNELERQGLTQAERNALLVAEAARNGDSRGARSASGENLDPATFERNLASALRKLGQEVGAEAGAAVSRSMGGSFGPTGPLAVMLDSIFRSQQGNLETGRSRTSGEGNVARVLIQNLDDIKVTDPDAAAKAAAIVDHLVEVSTNILTLQGVERELSGLQTAAITAGNTTLATQLGVQAQIIGAAIASQPPPNVNVVVNSSVTIRDVVQRASSFAVYHGRRND